MTYCLGWRTDTEVFVIADSAVTSIAPLGQGPVTNFGEAAIGENGIFVSEAALKVARVGNYGLTFAGDAAVGREFVNIVDYLVGHGIEIAAALTSAIQSVFPVNAPAPIEFVCAAYVKGSPVLYTFDASSETLLRDDQRRVHLGVMKSDFCGAVESFLDVAEQQVDEASHCLACVVAFLQTLSVKGNYLKEGVGGFFGGLYVNEFGVKWQPDIAFTFFTPDFGQDISKNADNPDPLVIVILRNDIAYIASPFKGRVEAYPRILPSEDKSDLLARLQLAESDIQAAKSDMIVDFVAMVSREHYVTALVEMKREPATRYLGIMKKPIIDGKGDFTFKISEDLGSFLLRKAEDQSKFAFRLKWYQPAGPNQMLPIQG